MFQGAVKFNKLCKTSCMCLQLYIDSLSCAYQKSYISIMWWALGNGKAVNSIAAVVHQVWLLGITGFPFEYSFSKFGVQFCVFTVLNLCSWNSVCLPHWEAQFQSWGLSWPWYWALWFLHVCCGPRFCDFMLMTNGIAHFLCLLMEQTNYFSFDKCNSSFNSHNFCFLTTSWSPTPLVVLVIAVTSVVSEWSLYLFFDTIFWHVYLINPGYSCFS